MTENDVKLVKEIERIMEEEGISDWLAELREVIDHTGG